MYWKLVSSVYTGTRPRDQQPKIPESIRDTGELGNVYTDRIYPLYYSVRMGKHSPLGVKLSKHVHLLPRLRISGAIPQLQHTP
jgi:hypothetical protein